MIFTFLIKDFVDVDKHKKIPRFMIDIPDSDDFSLVFIIENYVFSNDKRVYNEIDFIKKYIDIFTIVKNHDLYLSAKDIINDVNKGIPLETALKEYGL